MDLRFVFESGLPGGSGRPVYRRDDAYLLYETPGSEVPMEEREWPQSHPFYLIADTLTLVFGPLEHTFLSLDAYTRPMWWETVPGGAVPRPTGKGRLRVLDTPHDDDRESLGVVPLYQVSEDMKWIRILLSTQEVATDFNEVGDDLIVGLAGAQLTEVFLVDLTFEN